MRLSDAQIRNFKPQERTYRCFDGHGLYVEVTPTGSKLWRLKCRYAGKEKRLPLGKYPAVKLSAARHGRDAARLKLRDGIDPCLERKLAKAHQNLSAGNTFSAIADEYISKREKEGLAEATVKKARWVLKLFEAVIGGLPLDDISPELLLFALKIIEARGHHETARRARNFAGQVFQYGQITRRAISNPASLLRGALISPKPQHYAAILDETRLVAFLRAADHYSGPITRLALKILPHVFLRPGELRFATWNEINFEKAEWTIPADRTKTRRTHMVPLSPEVLKLLRETHELTGPEGYVFPAICAGKKPMSENTLNAALRRMGFKKDEATAHGFRATASTFLNQSGRFRSDVIERALAHAPLSAVRSAYDRGEYWDERVQMSKWWSEQLRTLQRD